MNDKKDLKISKALIKWYKAEKRDLPWRQTTDPYLIWLSEVILQQTRVIQGLSYYNKFVEKYPTVSLLAAAEEDEVLKLWQGLGYYSRARNLHAAAKMIVEKYNGYFPSEYKDVLSLKGIGEYTAAAIVSFAYNKPYAVVDGNVFRVLSRIFAINIPINSTKGKKVFSELAYALLDEENPGLHNQAIMEFGALQCVPVSPDCEACPLQSLCIAYNQHAVRLYPVKEKKQKVRERFFNYFDIRSEERMLLKKRCEKDIWQNLYELPLIETTEKKTIQQLQSSENFRKLISSGAHIRYIREIKHVLSHQIIYASFYKVEVHKLFANDEYLVINESDLDKYAVSRLVNKYLSE